MKNGKFDDLTVNLLSKLMGNVGVGTTVPVSRLDVRGSSKQNAYYIDDGQEDLRVLSSDNRPYDGGIITIGGVWGPTGYIKTMARNGKAGDIAIGNRRDVNATQMEPGILLDISGNVGIGTTNPKGKLSIMQTVAGLPTGLQISSHHTPGVVAGAIIDAFDDGGVTVRELTLQSNGGNVGIGTTRPSEKLEVNGNIKVSGDVQLVGGDCAEEFDVASAESVEPGTVMVIDKDGALQPCENAYDKRVAGVISGAGDLRPGITLDRQKERANRLPLALVGKVYCKVDAEQSSIELGDLLTTSSSLGHAMKATDPFKAFGSVIGKALRPFETGRGIIPILIALQ